MDELGFQLENGHASLRLGAGHGETLSHMLRARVGKGRSLFLQGNNQAVLFLPGAQSGVNDKKDLPALTLQTGTLDELCALLQSHAGTYQLASFPLSLELVPTKITDKDGNVIKVIE